MTHRALVGLCVIVLTVYLVARLMGAGLHF